MKKTVNGAAACAVCVLTAALLFAGCAKSGQTETAHQDMQKSGQKHSVDKF